MEPVRLGRGRPRKYGRPSRAISVTLPEDVLDRLGAVNPDLGQAIVELVARLQRTSRTRQHAPPRHVRHAAELAAYGSHAVIVVTPVKALKKLEGVQLVPLGDGRALISLDSPHSVASLELALRDRLERQDVAEVERETLDRIADILRDARRSRRVRLQERTIIVLESKRIRR